MFKLLFKIVPIPCAVLVASIYSNSAQAQVEVNETLNQIEQYTTEGKEDSINQITNVNQLKDVSPTDWSYEALRGLTERYGCISGNPDGTFQGERPITRNEFAAGLNSCFQQIERSINSQKQAIPDWSYSETVVFKEDGSFEVIHDAGFFALEGQVANVGYKIDKLESRTIELEANQFSTTTKLTGEAIFGVSDTFEGF